MKTILANENHLQIARKWFAENPEPDPNETVFPVMIIKSENKRYGKYNRLYLPLTGEEYINELPEEYEEYEENTFKFTPGNQYYTKSLVFYTNWQEADQFLELAVISQSRSRPDRKSNLDTRHWQYDNSKLSRCIIFANDPFVYFKNEIFNSKVGKYYNKEFVRQFDSTFSNYVIRFPEKVTNDMNKLLTDSGKESISWPYFFKHQYKQFVQHKIVDPSYFERKNADNLMDKLKPIDTSTWLAYTKKTSEYNTFFAHRKIIVDKIDKNNVCLRFFEAIGNTSYGDEGKIIEYTPSSWKENNRVFITPNGVFGYYNTWNKYRQVSNIMNIFRWGFYYIKDEHLFDDEFFDKYRPIINNVKYTNIQRVQIIIQFEKHKIVKELYDNGLMTIVESAIDQGEDILTTMRRLFEKDTRSEKVSKYIPWPMEYASKIINAVTTETIIKHDVFEQEDVSTINHHLLYSINAEEITKVLEHRVLSETEVGILAKNIGIILNDLYSPVGIVKMANIYPTADYDRIINFLLIQDEALVKQMGSIMRAICLVTTNAQEVKDLGLDFYDPEQIDYNTKALEAIGITI